MNAPATAAQPVVDGQAVDAATLHRVEQFLYRHAALCDAHDWDAYLETYTPDAVFHMPQWDGDLVHTSDPTREMSLIYYPSRAGLEDRVFRLRTQASAASMPLPRTMHQISNVRATRQADGLLRADANWLTCYVRHGEAGMFFGRATYELRPDAHGWRIARKHCLLLNDTINAVLDFYHV
ncbi:anthranilate 1,2-dioxygenase small subunit [Verticiella sediminum]|uniref:Anthranilate 1,2-dioxygenase small subunit n=2 Tax=Verticiella sediminum TaxID=1247510 RepID=A0A556AXN2_9BURK|nr:anthranilate 1,2-dioxygenase small subunit [Verticiella sediminum]